MRLLLIEDSHTLLDSLRSRLGREGYEVAAASDGLTGLRMAQAGHFDLIVLDLMIPGLSGMELLGRLRQTGNEAHVLILSALDGVQDRVLGLQAGADDYLVKPFSFEELLARIQALGRRAFGKKSPELVIGPLALDTIGRCARVAGQDLGLTHREFRLLEYLALRRGEIVSREEIQEHLYGTSTLPMSNAVDSAICVLRGKLKRCTAEPLIHTKPRLGYLLECLGEHAAP